MRVCGIDFTSAPRPAKRIACVVCELQGSRLTVDEIHGWSGFDGFESLLRQPGPWVAAVDFPLGQPRRLVEALGWPDRWSAYVDEVGKMTKAEFVDTITRYREKQPVGQKHHLRETDARAGACSPMMLFGVPVGKMFFEGSPRLLKSGVSVVPCRPNTSGRTVVEGYPALVARYLLGSRTYKSDKQNLAGHRERRREMLEKCRRGSHLRAYGIQLQIASPTGRQLVDECTGDALDAMFCAIQAAAWCVRRDQRDLVPEAADPLEGWIVDPTYAGPTQRHGQAGRNDE